MVYWQITVHCLQLVSFIAALLGLTEIFLAVLLMKTTGCQRGRIWMHWKVILQALAHNKNWWCQSRCPLNKYSPVHPIWHLHSNTGKVNWRIMHDEEDNGCSKQADSRTVLFVARLCSIVLANNRQWAIRFNKTHWKITSFIFHLTITMMCTHHDLDPTNPKQTNEFNNRKQTTGKQMVTWSTVSIKALWWPDMAWWSSVWLSQICSHRQCSHS